ncbi:hypothetical protein ANN_21546 [Periplaneta americana]|uniref:Uncharacterized protein n=1 Tax=Periplaneta americana TaxID=6978 RepID=A0ABQ8S5S9_PERAM|nr:hypothetical protein ANN_21546 [Periplaneta americana]
MLSFNIHLNRRTNDQRLAWLKRIFMYVIRFVAKRTHPSIRAIPSQIDRNIEKIDLTISKYNETLFSNEIKSAASSELLSLLPGLVQNSRSLDEVIEKSKENWEDKFKRFLGSRLDDKSFSTE